MNDPPDRYKYDPLWRTIVSKAVSMGFDRNDVLDQIGEFDREMDKAEYAHLSKYEMDYEVEKKTWEVFCML